MATQQQFRRGSTAEHSIFTGALAEMTVDTTKNVLVVHDGSTVGGTPLATESDVLTLQSDVGTLQTDVGTLQTDVSTNQTNIGTLQTDVGTLQTDVGTLQTDVSTNQTDIGTLQTDVGTLQTDVGTNQTNIGTLQTDVGTNQTNIGTLQTDVGTLQTDVGTNQTDIGTLQTDVGTLQSDVSALQARPRKNHIINGKFDVAQRSFFQLSAGYGSVDRWWFDNITQVVRQQDGPSGVAFSMKITPTTSTSYNMVQTVHLDVIWLDGKTITISFWGKSDAPKVVSTTIDTGPTTVLHNLTTTWQKFTHTLVCPTSSPGPRLQFLNNGDTTPYYISQVQIEEGSEATDYEYRSYDEEIALCQRYYVKSYDWLDYPTFTSIGGSLGGISNASGNVLINVRYPTAMIGTPTVTTYSPATGFASKIDFGGVDANTVVSNSGDSGCVISAAGAANTTTGVHFTADAEIF